MDKTSIIAIVVNCMLCGLAFKKLFDGFLGFIPFVGEIFCLSKLADIYNKEAKRGIIVSYIVKIVFSIIVFVLEPFVIMYKQSGDVKMLKMSVAALVVCAAIFTLSIFFMITYRYKVVEEYLNAKTGKKNKFLIFIISIFIQLFFIYVIVKDGKNNEDTLELK